MLQQPVKKRLPWVRSYVMGRRFPQRMHQTNAQLFPLLHRGLLLLGMIPALTQIEPASAADNMVVRSSSGQITVTGPQFLEKRSAGTGRHDESSGAKLIQLRPGQVAHSCEQVKQVLLTALRADDTWHNRILIAIDPRLPPDSDILIASVLYRDGWRYRMRLPVHVAPDKLVRAFVKVLLQEWADRSSTGRASEVPLWLIDGMARHLVAISPGPLVLESNTTTFLGSNRVSPLKHIVNYNKVVEDPLLSLREYLRTHEALAFSDLDQPADVRMEPEQWENFRTSAHGFVHHLLRLKNGQEAMKSMLAALPEHLNWQFAFLEGYSRHFKTLLDVEKWWSLTVADLRLRDGFNRFSYEAALRQLGDLLEAPVAVGASTTNAEPARQTFELQLLIDLVDYPRQRTALQGILLQLQGLQLQAPPELRKLISDYRSTLNSYLERRDKLSSAAERNLKSGLNITHKAIVRDTLDRLKFLDVIRKDMGIYGPRTAAEEPEAAEEDKEKPESPGPAVSAVR